ncbi:hypothetical protein MKJ04_08320 [Pontibacter sp. E15-1]|uniref:hypothetical protein n=1 Tax=Pontibacter sp. E15-1 TaxID=2919918 RepID=UPI001F4FBFD4|nr:hypothetical protein [Pontibacter sp. E15-1]MCJ8164846.1 hypothetical protein [Pontibacter sp. E15-1]
MRLKQFKLAAVAGTALLLNLVAIGVCGAQSLPADTAFVHSAVQNAEAVYKQAVGLQSHLYNGTEYVDYRKPYLDGDQFFVSKDMVRGDIWYDGAWHRQVPMLYDLVTDEVVMPHNIKGLLMRLINEKVDTFHLRGHTFVRLQADSTGQDELRPGFYDLLYNGHAAKLLVRRTKNIQDRATPQGMEGEFRVSDKLYILKDGVYHQVRSKRAVFKVLKDEKKQLQRHAASQKLKFRKEKEQAILSTVSYYNSLSEKQTHAD